QRQTLVMGGGISVTSKPGSGSCFCVEVPLSEVQASLVPHQAGSGKPLRLASGSSVRALVVDDVGQNRDLLFDLLFSIGCDVSVAVSGAQALELVRMRIPDVVFLDIRMPDTDGIQTAKHIRSEFGRRRMKIVAVSASALMHEQQRCLEC